MVIQWNIPVEQARVDPASLSELAKELMPVFSMDEDEYRVRVNVIDGSPDALRFDRWVTPFMVAVYDVMIIPDEQQRAVVLRFRLYKGMALAMIVWFISGFMAGSMLRWESMLLPTLILLLFSGMAALQIQISKHEAVNIIQRWGRASALGPISKMSK
jgi:hypothetical protein